MMKVSIDIRWKDFRKLTNAPGLCVAAKGLAALEMPASNGVVPPLPPFAACSAFRALCSANLFFKSAGDSTFGFFDCPPPALAVPGAGFPVAARRSCSA